MDKFKNKFLINFRKGVERGKEGKNAGLPIRSPKLSRHIHGLLPKRIILVGGDTGSGKTAYVDDHLVVTPHLWLLDNPFHPVRLKTQYWSLEISPEEKIAKWVCAEIFKKYGNDIRLISYNDGKETKLIDSDYILGRALDTEEMPIEIEEQHEFMIDEQMERMDALLENIEFITSNPDKKHIVNRLDSVANTYGEFEIFKGERIYHDKAPDIMRQFVYDHVGLFTKGAKGKKDTIDDVSAEWIYYRNACHYNIVPISQFNRNIQDVQRAKLGVEPQLGDFKDTSNTQEDANQVIALFDPYRYKVHDWEGYAINQMKDRFRGVIILKNRHGLANKKFGLQFVGEVGMTNEMKLPNELSQVDYQRLINLR
jgi:replicative DNA helicase